MSTDFAAPRSLDELAAVLARATDRTCLIAGGTDLMLELRSGVIRPDLLIDVTKVTAMQGVRRDGDLLTIGAATTFGALLADRDVRSVAPCLADAAALLGSLQIRNAATIAGNVVNASACSDGITALLALDATFGVMGPDGRVVHRSLDQLVLGTGRTSLRTGEVVVEVAIRCGAGDRSSAFVKVGDRAAVTVSKLSIAAVIDGTGTERRARVAVGSLAPTAFVDPSLGVALDAAISTGSDADGAFAEALVATVDRSIPDRASRHYKRHAARGVAADLLATLRARQDLVL